MTMVFIFVSVIVLLIIGLIINTKGKEDKRTNSLNENEEYITQGTRKNIEDPKKL
ncbi:hypothetical protein SAMN05216389_10860 [Oceanobacillus limi]|uniref:Uncharacterized protein n=1 Tax=Oceanobacillus limi TaxID=930131 RepID=A0A1I0D8F9_9BACI|nr:hypothetical protein [Oceanobacillus limi]SET28357.1 hypothetical protein SAMN05216389_10860 [Oceanobacillus limi]